MTPVYLDQVGGPMAWTGKDIPSKETFVYELSPKNVAAVDAVLEHARDVPRDDITQEQARHPELDGDLAKVYEELMRGRGLVVLRGFPVERPIEDVERFYWVVMSHFGRLLSNTSRGDRMVNVQQELLPGGVQPARGTKSTAELAMHNDSSDILGLLCVHEPLSGGESQFSSGVAAHNTILATRPEILPILYRGFPHHRRSEQYDDQPDVTPYDVPIFSAVGDRICINFTWSSILPALHAIGRELTAQEEEAVEILRRVLLEQQVEFTLARGELVLGNNYAMCHSRSDYVDGPDPAKRRLLLRAWTEVPRADRRLPLGREYYHMENKGGGLGYDPVPGRRDRIAGNDYSNVDENLANLFKAAQAKPKPAARNG
jgi:hypothetical protein